MYASSADVGPRVYDFLGPTSADDIHTASI